MAAGDRDNDSSKTRDLSSLVEISMVWRMPVWTVVIVAGVIGGLVLHRGRNFCAVCRNRGAANCLQGRTLAT